MLYVTPELVNTDFFMKILESLYGRNCLACFAIDGIVYKNIILILCTYSCLEAHCIRFILFGSNALVVLTPLKLMGT